VYVCDNVMFIVYRRSDLTLTMLGLSLTIIFAALLLLAIDL